MPPQPPSGRSILIVSSPHHLSLSSRYTKNALRFIKIFFFKEKEFKTRISGGKFWITTASEAFLHLSRLAVTTSQ